MVYYFESRGVLTEENKKSIVNNGVFYDKVYVSCDGHGFTYEFDTQRVTLENKESKKFFKFETRKLEGGANLNKYEKSEKVTQCVVSFTHPLHGTMSLELNYFSNPQIKYGIGMCIPDSGVEELDGLLIREYLTESIDTKINDESYKTGILGKNGVISEMVLITSK